MDIEEIRKLKAETEEKILDLLKDFYTKTTICPIKLELERLYIRTYSDTNPSGGYLLNSITLTTKSV